MNDNLINEFKAYSQNTAFKAKVERVYRKAFIAGKHELAYRIKAKYPEVFIHNDDLIMAFSLAMLWSNKNVNSRLSDFKPL